MSQHADGQTEVPKWKQVAGKAIQEEVDRQVLSDLTEHLLSSTPPDEDSPFHEMWHTLERRVDNMRHGNWDLVPDEVEHRIKSTPTHADVEHRQAFHGICGSDAEEDLVPVPWPEEWGASPTDEELCSRGVTPL